MFHSKHITYSSGGSAGSPTPNIYKVNKGVLHYIFVNFPPGCRGLVKLRISVNGSPILPVEKDAYINYDSYVLEAPVFIEVKEEPLTVLVEGWNEDDTYDHTIDIGFSIVNKEWIQPVGAYEGVIAALKSIFARR